MNKKNIIQKKHYWHQFFLIFVFILFYFIFFGNVSQAATVRLITRETYTDWDNNKVVVGDISGSTIYFGTAGHVDVPGTYYDISGLTAGLTLDNNNFPGWFPIDARHSSVTSGLTTKTYSVSNQLSSITPTSDFWPTVYYLDLVLNLAQGLKIYVKDTSGNSIQDFTLHYGAWSAPYTNTGGELTIDDLVPGVYPVYISADGYTDSDTHNVDLDSSPFYVLEYFFLNQNTGSLKGHIRDTDGNPLGGADLCYGATPLGFTTDASGYYDVANVTVGTYTNISACGITGMADDNPPVNITIIANTSVTQDFVMHYTSMSAVWLSPSDNSSYASSENLDFQVKVNINFDLPNTCLYFLIDGTSVCNACGDIKADVTKDFSCSKSLAAYSTGNHTVEVNFNIDGGAQQGLFVNGDARNIDISLLNSSIRGMVYSCNKGPDNLWILVFGLDDANVYHNGAGPDITSLGNYQIDNLSPLTNYNLVAKKSGYQDSDIQSVQTAANGSVTADTICLQTLSGAILGDIQTSSGIKQDNVSLTIDGVDSGTTATYAISGQPGVFVISDLSTGAHTMKFSKTIFGSLYTSPTYNIDVVTNSTKTYNFTLYPPAPPASTFNIQSFSSDLSSGSAPLTVTYTTVIDPSSTASTPTYYTPDCGSGFITPSVLSSNDSQHIFSCSYDTEGTYTASISARRETYTVSRTKNISVSSPFVDIGLKIYDGNDNIAIACEPSGTLTSPLRIRKNGITYGISLVDLSDSKASKIRVRTPSGTKALMKY